MLIYNNQLKMKDIYRIFLISVFGFAVIVFVLLFYISAPYGKFLRKGWGPVSHVQMGLDDYGTAITGLNDFFLSDFIRKVNVAVIFLILWLLHYIHRTFIYSFRQSGKR